MKQTQPQWTKEQLEEIYASFNECAKVTDRLGRKKKTKDSEPKPDVKE
jgi:hypothetical protein